MDDLDGQIVQLLRRDGRISISNVASRLGFSRATVRSRLEALLSSGEILGFTAVLKGDTYEQPVRGVMMIEVEGKVTDRVISVLDRMQEVLAIHTTNGRWDLVVELGTESLEKLDVVLRKVRLVDGITNSETNLYLATKRNSRVQKADTPFT